MFKALVLSLLLFSTSAIAETIPVIPKTPAPQSMCMNYSEGYGFFESQGFKVLLGGRMNEITGLEVYYNTEESKTVFVLVKLVENKPSEMCITALLPKTRFNEELIKKLNFHFAHPV